LGCTGVLAAVLQETVRAGAPEDALIVALQPNPATDRTRLKLALPAQADLEIALLDATGRVLAKRHLERFKQGEIEFDLRKYPAGLYQVRARAGERSAVRKLVVER
jgi:hypothetical protein